MRGLNDNLKFVTGVILGGLAGYALREWTNSKDGKELINRISKPFESTAKPDAAPVEKPVDEKPVVADVKTNPMERSHANGESDALVRNDSLDE